MNPPNNSLALTAVIVGSIAAALALFGGFAPPAGIVSPAALVLAAPLGLLAIIFGFIGISTANRLDGKRKGQAIAGVVLGFGLIVFYVVGVIFRLAIIG